MWNLWSRIVRPKKRKCVSFEVGMAYDVLGQTMVVVEAKYYMGQFILVLASEEKYKAMLRGA